MNLTRQFSSLLILFLQKKLPRNGNYAGKMNTILKKYGKLD